MRGAVGTTLNLKAPSSPLRGRFERLVIAGWAGRDEAGVRHHIAELAALGVRPPRQVRRNRPSARRGGWPKRTPISRRMSSRSAALNGEAGCSRRSMGQSTIRAGGAPRRVGEGVATGAASAASSCGHPRNRGPFGSG